jgi:hypothetical protein
VEAPSLEAMLNSVEDCPVESPGPDESEYPGLRWISFLQCGLRKS